MAASTIFEIPENLPEGGERSEILLTAGGILIERIISRGHSTEEGKWYDQERDEWVLVLRGEATLAYEDRTEVHLSVGQSLLLPAHRKHRVVTTSSDPPCLWLCIHAMMR